MNRLYDFKKFAKTLNENCEARQSAISITLSHIKEEFGDPNKDVKSFLSKVKEKGGTGALEKFIVKEVEPRIDKITAQERLTGGFDYDYDEILRGLIAFFVVKLQLQKKKMDVEKK